MLMIHGGTKVCVVGVDKVCVVIVVLFKLFLFLIFKDPWLEDLFVIDISHGMFPGDRIWDII